MPMQIGQVNLSIHRKGGASNFDSASKNFYTLNTKNIKWNLDQHGL